jgi:4-alpha-glucanotransferase
MRHAGGLRIDHVMALQHLYWVPEGGSPAEGAYVRYPMEDLVGILALESQRQKCLVVGEDLGTVPEGFRERMASANILSYRVLAFEQDAQGFIPPEQYPVLSVAVAGSHDLPTVRGWWRGRDIELKKTLDLYPTRDGAEQARADREQDRLHLIEALRRAQVLPESGTLDSEDLPRLVHIFLARSRSMLALVQLDDITNEVEPVNLPTTSNEHPNWRRRQSMTLEQLAEDPALETVARIFATERPHERY